MVHTAGFVDPGFSGQLTLELTNCHHEDTIHIPSGTAICTITFYEVFGKVERLYGSEGLGSHYQGQTGTTPAFDA